MPRELRNVRRNRPPFKVQTQPGVRNGRRVSYRGLSIERSQMLSVRYFSKKLHKLGQPHE